MAAAFFVYGILLMVEGFFTTGAIRDLYGDFKITACGRCVSAWVSPTTHLKELMHKRESMLSNKMQKPMILKLCPSQNGIYNYIYLHILSLACFKCLH